MAKLLILLAAVGAVFVLIHGVEATTETTCREAAASDKRVDYNFCVDQLNAHHDSTEADAWRLAQITAEIGANHAGNAVVDIKALLAKPGTGGGGKAREALERCQQMYDRMEVAFLGAYDDINARNYAAGKKKVAEAAPLAQACEDAFARGGVPSPLTKRRADSVQLAIICTAITNLIK